MVMPTIAKRWLIGGALVIAVAPAARSSRVHAARSPGLSYTVTAVVYGSPTVSGLSRADTSVWVEQFNSDNWRTDTCRMADYFVHVTDSLRRVDGLQVGVYTLRRRGSPILTVVDSAKREYFAYDADSARQGTVLIERVPHPGDTVFAVRVHPDTVIDGRHTEHWRRTNIFTTRAPLVGEHTNHIVADIYIATATKEMGFGTFEWMRESPLAGVAYSRELEETEAKMPQGLRVLIVSGSAANHNAGSMPAPGGIVFTQRLSDIQYRDIPDHVFVVPAGYQRVAPPASPALRTAPSPAK
jgi:hypothetical protein